MSVLSWNCATVQMLAAAHTVRCLQHPGLLYLWAVPAICGAESVSDCSLGSICLGFATYFQSRSLAHRCASHVDVKWCEWLLCARMLVRVNKQDNVTLTTIYRRHRGRSASVELWTEKESGGWRYLRVSLSVCVRICQTCECVCAWEREKQWGGYSSLTQLTVLEDPSSDPGTATQRCQAQHTQVGHTEQLRGQVGLAQVM